MRRDTAWISRWRSRTLLVLLALLAAGTGARAQGGLSTEGGLFLLLPIGARAVGMGQATAATTTGSEAVWWNPAGLVVDNKREAAIHHSQSILGNGDALSIVMPSQLLGTLALSLDVLNYGEFPLTDSVNPDVPLGTIIPRNVIYGVSYASGIGKLLAVGLTYKVVQLKDVANGLIKSLAFAFVIGTVSCHQGLTTIGGPRGIGRSVTKAVVNSIVLILILDYYITRVMLAIDHD